MAFIRTKRVKRNGKVYVYQYRQQSVRIGKKVKSLHLGRGDIVDHEGRPMGWLRRQIQPEPGMYLGMKMQAASDKLRADMEAKAKAAETKEKTAPDNESGKTVTPDASEPPSTEATAEATSTGSAGSQ
jgi:hypothetical protein